jgi:hypothetical protein
VIISLTLSALNYLEVKMGYIENAYLTAPVTEKVWTVLGPEFGDDAGKRELIVTSLYGLKYAVIAFRNNLSACMENLGCKLCLADHDSWMNDEG